MKKLLILFMTVLLLAACGNDDKKEPVAEAEKPIETPKQDVAKQEVDEQEEAEEAHGSIEAEELEEIIDFNALAEDDGLVSVSIESEEIKATIQLAPHDSLSAKDLAVSSYSRASDALLEHDGWETLTIEYVGVGTISINRSEKEANEYGMEYFPTEIIVDKLE